MTHGPTWATKHGLGDISLCALCHQSVECVACHGTPLPHPADFGRNHGGFAEVPGEQCGTCHNRAAFCDACHGVPMPHPLSFLQTHVKFSKGSRDPRCLKCHRVGGCASCHEKHAHPSSTKGTLRGSRLPTVSP